MTELNDVGPVQVFDRKPYSFRIKKDTRGFKPYTINGIAERVKVPEVQSFKSLSEVFADPAKADSFGFLMIPFMKLIGTERSEQLHLALRSVQKFREIHDM
jgi:hypothetical protein